MDRLRDRLLPVLLGVLLAAALPILADGNDEVKAAAKKEGASPAKKSGGKKKEKPDPVKLLGEAAEKWNKVKTMHTIFCRRERLPGRAKLYNEQVIFMRARKEPFSIYMHWIGDEYKDREVMYIEGQNDNKFKGRLGGIAGLVTVTRKPDHPIVFKYSRHTVLEGGIWNLINRLKTRMTSANKVARTYYKGIHKFNGRDCHKFYRYLPDKRDEKGNNVYYAWRVEMWYDIEYKLPVVLRMYDWDKKLFEEYTYKDVVADAPLTDDDFQLGSHKD